MTMTGEELKKIAFEKLGFGYQTRLAPLLGVTVGTINRMCNNKIAITLQVEKHIRLLLKD